MLILHMKSSNKTCSGKLYFFHLFLSNYETLRSNYTWEFAKFVNFSQNTGVDLYARSTCRRVYTVLHNTRILGLKRNVCLQEGEVGPFITVRSPENVDSPCL